MAQAMLSVNLMAQQEVRATLAIVVTVKIPLTVVTTPPPAIVPIIISSITTSLVDDNLHLWNGNGASMLIKNKTTLPAPSLLPVVITVNAFFWNDMQTKAPAHAGLADMQWLKRPIATCAISLRVEIIISAHSNKGKESDWLLAFIALVAIAEEIALPPLLFSALSPIKPYSVLDALRRCGRSLNLKGAIVQNR